jgi:hypothetical protein
VSKGEDGIGTVQGVFSAAASAGREFERFKEPASAEEEPRENEREAAVSV